MSEMVEIKTRIPANYYRVLKEMIALDIEDTEEQFLRKIIMGDIEAIANISDTITDPFHSLWDTILRSTQSNQTY